MFTEFMYIALAVCLLLGACSEVGLGYGMSFGALLTTATLIIMAGIFYNIQMTGLTSAKTTGCVTKCVTELFISSLHGIYMVFTSCHRV